MAVSDDFKSRFPEFDAVTVDQYIPILEPVWPSYWGGGLCCPQRSGDRSESDSSLDNCRDFSG